MIAPERLVNNRQQMIAALERLRTILEAHAAQRSAEAGPLIVDPQSALAHICRTFDLTDFERDVLILAAAPELDGSFPGLIASASGDSSRTSPTFSLALAALPVPAWSAVLPSAPLRRWQLVHVDGAALVGATLRAAEPLMHALLGFSYNDPALAAIVVDDPPGLDRLAVTQEQTARQLAEYCRSVRDGKVQLVCADRLLAYGIARRTAEMLRMRTMRIRAAAMPTHPAEVMDALRACERALLLTGSIACVECDESDDPAYARTLTLMADRFALQALFMTSARTEIGGVAMPAVEVPRATREEQAALWNARLPNTAEGIGRRLAAQFDLHLDTIEVAASSARDGTLGEVWSIVREQTRPALGALMERVDADRKWSDLVLPADRRRLVRQVVDHVRCRDRVFGEWGFANATISQGVTVLFAGPSGTGKSLAARVVAHALELDLYRIDLSAMFSKYIGETEKNLRRIFDAAERGGAVLLFDEADAVFGKRSDVHDSHDRHANVEVSYLLQRLETFSGLAILTSNLREAFDVAFMRRFAYVVDFPFPDAPLRKRMWRRVFPATTPLEPIDLDLLARIPLPGGNIRNIALNAAVHAAARSGRVGMAEIAAAVKLEYAKLDRSVHDPDLTRWLESVARRSPVLGVAG